MTNDELIILMCGILYKNNKLKQQKEKEIDNTTVDSTKEITSTNKEYSNDELTSATIVEETTVEDIVSDTDVSIENTDTISEISEECNCSEVTDIVDSDIQDIIEEDICTVDTIHFNDKTVKNTGKMCLFRN